ncbi:MAG: hypothetical protein V8Q43_01790 [Christensenellaceae bacterium]
MTELHGSIEQVRKRESPENGMNYLDKLVCGLQDARKVEQHEDDTTDRRKHQKCINGKRGMFAVPIDLHSGRASPGIL